MTEKKYIVTNDQVIELLKKYISSTGKEKYKAQNVIVKKLSFFVCAKIKKYKKQQYYTDLLHEGQAGMIKAIRDFDFSRGINFFKFASWHVKGRIKSFLRWNNRYKLIATENEAVDPVAIFEQKEKRKVIIKALKSLPEIDRYILSLRFGIYDDNIYTLRQISSKLLISKQRVEQIQKKALLKLKDNQEIRNLVEDN